LLVLIDESGCTGFKLDKGSSPYFVVAMVIFNDFLSAEKTSAAIDQLRKVLRVKPEFKFSKCSHEVRDHFFQEICQRQHQFTVRGLVVEKQAIYSQFLRCNNECFYNFFVRNLILYNGDCLVNATVKIDGSGNREFQRAMSSYLKKHVGSDKINKIKLIDSKKDNLIQLADMVVGAIARKYNLNRDEHDRWFKILQSSKKISNIWSFK
jgi:hypothetical protein